VTAPATAPATRRAIADVSIADTAAFMRCVHDTASHAAIAAGRQLGRDLAISGTPTIFVNGWRFTSPPDDATLQRVVGRLRAGQDPTR